MRFLVVINPSARDFEAQRRWPSMKARLERAAELTVVETSPDDAETKARVRQSLAALSFARLVAIGGDGTVHLVVNALMEAGLPVLPELAVIPFGTANDVAKSLELPLGDPDALAEIACGPRTGALDICSVEAAGDQGQTRKVFWLDSVTIGMDADVLVARGRYRELGGYLAYAAALAERAVQQQSLDVRVTLDGNVVDARVFNIIVNNVPIYAGELRMPDSFGDDGQLDVYLFNRREYTSKLLSFAIRQADLLKLGINELLEDLTENQRTLHGRTVSIRLAMPRQVQVDGEVFSEANEIRCAVVGRLRVALPLP
jgi:diacylglycerol kinase (ATP)